MPVNFSSPVLLPVCCLHSRPHPNRNKDRYFFSPELSQLNESFSWPLLLFPALHLHLSCQYNWRCFNIAAIASFHSSWCLGTLVSPLAALCLLDDNHTGEIIDVYSAKWKWLRGLMWKMSLCSMFFCLCLLSGTDLHSEARQHRLAQHNGKLRTHLMWRRHKHTHWSMPRGVCCSIYGVSEYVEDAAGEACSLSFSLSTAKSMLFLFSHHNLRKVNRTDCVTSCNSQ